MTELYELQSVPLTRDSRIRPLYYHYRGGDNQLPVVRDNLKAIILSRGCEFSLNSYFGSFYECYWRRYTPVTEVFLTFRLNGKARLRLYRFSPEIKQELLHEADLIGTGETITIPVREPEPYPTTHGRIYPQFLTLEDNTILSDLCWKTTLPPQREARLEATMCVFNRDKELAENLGSFAHLQRENLLHAITIVNHASKGLRERLRKLLPDHAKDMPYKLIDQPNTGSAGGMARGIIEALESGTSNYLVRYDDDIRMDYEVMRRLPILLGYINENIAVGSHMLDGLTRVGMYEAGATIHPEFLGLKSIAYGLDITNGDKLNRFAQVDFIDYNAWWCFSFPLNVLSKDEVPLPFFIRIDDIEYSYLLREKGVQSVSWAGLAVWHEPFYIKQNPYLRYYSQRNFMFAFTFYNVFDKRGTLRSLRLNFINFLLQYYYPRAWAVVRTMEDFLKGPELLANWTEESHRQLIAEEKLWTEKDLPRSTGAPVVQRVEKTAKAPRYKRLWPFFAYLRILSDLLRPVHSQSPLKYVDYWTKWHLWGAKGLDRVTVNHDRADVCHVYHRDRRKLARLLFRFWKAYIRILLSPNPRYKRADMEKFRTESFWRTQLWREQPPN